MDTSLSIPRAGWLGLIALGFLWGTSFLATSVGVHELSPAWVVMARVWGASATLWLVVLIRRDPLPKGARVWGALAVMGLLNHAVPFTLISWGQQHIASGLASILNASTAIFGVVVSALLLADERLTRRRGLGVSLGFAGVALAIGPGVLHEFDLRSVGQLVLMVSSLSYALAGVWARRTLPCLPPMSTAATTLGFAGLWVLPIAVLHDGAPPVPSLAATAGLVYLAIAATAVASSVYFKILPMIGAGNALLSTLLVAPVAILLGAVVLGETLQPTAYAGFALLALGLLTIDGRVWTWARQRLRAPA